MLSRMVAGPLGDEEIGGIFVQAPRPPERRPPPDDASNQDHRRTRQRRGSSGSGVARRTESVATQTTTPSAMPPSLAQTQAPSIPSSVPGTQSAFRLWPSRDQTRVSPSAQQPPRVSFNIPFGYVSEQNEFIARHTQATGTIAQPSNIMRPSTARVAGQPEEGLMPNPLQGQTPRRQQPVSPQSPTQGRTELSAGERAARQQLEMLRPERNRPW